MVRQRRFSCLVTAAIGLLLLVCSHAVAASTSCIAQFAGGEAPTLINRKLARETVTLCFTGFATLYSGLTRTPLYSAEHLTADRFAAAETVIRADRFHPEPLVPYALRSELSDYRGSGYDRGHMAPNADMPDDAAQVEAFSLANIVPQDHDDNVGLWAAIEVSVRATALIDGEVFVVTGPLFEGADLEARATCKMARPR